MAATRAAIVTVHDKSGLPELAGELHRLGYNLIGSAGTMSAINTGGLGGVSIEGHVGTCLDVRRFIGREEATGALAGRIADGNPEIEIVICNLRPPQLEDDGLKSDVGGLSLVRAAALRGLLVIVDPADYEDLASLLRCASADDLEAFRRRMREKALAVVSSYVQAEASLLYRVGF